MIRTVAIVGAGTMGGGIAITCMKAGLSVSVIDMSDTSLERMKHRAERHFTREVEKGRMTEEDAEAAQALLSLSVDLDKVSSADLVIEAVFEDLQIKRDLMTRIEPLLRSDCVIATNTSCLMVRDIAASLRHPDRMLGLHYFSPAEISPIVEVVSTDDTRPEALNKALGFLGTTGKTSLPCKDSPGFALNRFFCPYCNEAVRCLDEGLASTGQIDLIAQEDLEVAAGPFQVMNLIKPRIMLKAMESLAPLGPFYAPARGLTELGATEGSWEIEDPVEPVDANLRAAVADRLTGAILLPALDAIEEGVVSERDLDMGAKAALRFTRTPIVLRDQLAANDVERIVEVLRVRH